MRTIFVEEPDPAVAVAERDEILAQQPDTHRRPIELGDLTHKQGRDPIAPHCLAHRCPTSDPGQQLVFLTYKHGSSSRLVLAIIAPRLLQAQALSSDARGKA